MGGRDLVVSPAPSVSINDSSHVPFDAQACRTWTGRRFRAAAGPFEKLVAVATVIPVTTATMMTIRSRDRIFIVLAGTMRVCRLGIRRGDLRIRSREVFMGTGAFTD